MLVSLAANVSAPQLRDVLAAAAQFGLVAHRLPRKDALALVPPVEGGAGGTLAAPGAPGAVAALGAAGVAERLGRLPGVLQVHAVDVPYVLVSRAANPAGLVVDVAGAKVGGSAVALMAGPCAVEDEAQLLACAAAARAAGAQFLRGGAFKPRTSPYEFQGLGEPGLKLLATAAARHELRVVTEVVSPEDVPCVAHYAHLLQVGARNMQNFALLRAVGQQRRPVLLKRGLCATYREWLLAAEYVAAHGNPNIILCERGIRTFEPETRNTLDVAAVPVLRTMTQLPILIDPSHATGRRDAVVAVARAGVAAGADGILVEVHPNPARARSDGPQSLTLPALAELARSLARVAAAVDRDFGGTKDATYAA